MSADGGLASLEEEDLTDVTLVYQDGQQRGHRRLFGVTTLSSLSSRWGGDMVRLYRRSEVKEYSKLLDVTLAYKGFSLVRDYQAH